MPIKYFTARIVVFDVKMPLLRGTRAELFAHSQRMPCVIVRLKCVLNKTTRQAVKENPRYRHNVFVSFEKLLHN